MTDLDALRTRCRGLKKGSLTLEEAQSLADRFALSPMAKVIRSMLRAIGDSDRDLYLHEGDLVVEGPLSVAELGALVLVVKGDLVVKGCYSDADDPQTITLVEGNLRAASIVTAGFLEVRGDVRCDGPMLGDYNDCNCLVHGSVHCNLFYPEEHFFEVRGGLVARVALGNVKYRVSGPGTKPEALELDDPRLLDHFDRELLVIDEEEGQPPVVDGFESYRAVRQRVREGKPLKTR
ncbi:MAG: hypothetical protein ACOZQL_02550 [Myxococcota bacterium]